VHDQLPDHLLRVYRFAFHLCGDQHLAEDLAQETMLRAVRSGNGLRDHRAIRVWLLRIVENLWIDWCRTQGRRQCEMIPESEIVQEMPGPLELVSQAEQVGLTIAAMRTLPERQRSVLHLIACEELTVSETAEVLQITPEAVRSSLSLARCRMRLMLKPRDNMDQKNTILNEDNIS
jgi:RNA polymerase sigma-70 factor (ECF subfamily)